MHINRSVPQEIREISNKKPHILPKAVRKRRTPKLVVMCGRENWTVKNAEN